ncbi:hypothetical protein SAMN04487995_1466 [Dyadobacter koreensis]|uniref:Uncharacterized protein n=1 Tax=Dyadobacter koreensis TaxID=408657 RepID=A0A1H6S2N4_9BACT|nr:hypothetical protein SAMN04487995_1466 [Dyadobacter koreensis]
MPLPLFKAYIISAKTKNSVNINVNVFIPKYMIYGTAPVQITNRKARKLSEDLEDLHLIKLLKSEQQPVRKLSEKYLGKLSSDVANDMLVHLKQSRDEWKNRNT